jgi:hypothetical protein
MSGFTTMLAHPFPPSHQPNLPPNLDPNHDPFQSLYDSLANLTLTTGIPLPTPTNIPATHPNPAQHQLQPSPPSSINSDPNLETVTITPLFPPGDNVIFAHSSFFCRYIYSPNPELPTPAQVREQAAALGITDEGAKLVPFPSLGLLVKYGPELDNNAGGCVSAAEGKAMMLLRRALPSLLPEREGVPVPVPEVFGWRRDAGTGERFVYMDLPHGEVLGDRWAGMSEIEREGVCAQLKGWVGAWRRLRLGGVGFLGESLYLHGPKF